MVTVTPTDIVALAPEFADTSEATIALYISLAADFFCVERYGARGKTALTFMALHLLSMQGQVGSSGAITSESVGSVSTSYAVSSSDSDLASTPYGRMFLRLQGNSAIGAFVT